MHEAAAIVTFLSPGLRFFHQGQFEGRKKRISPHLVRGPREPMDERLAQFYDRLLAVTRRQVVRSGDWQLLESAAAWDGNWTQDCFVAFAWQDDAGDRVVMAVNYAPNQSQCYLRLPFPDLRDRRWHLQDLIANARYERDGSELQAHGLYIDLAPWRYHVFALEEFP
jgi:hypothetical protein